MSERIGNRTISHAQDETDYSKNVSDLIEIGTGTSGIGTSWTAWRPDAYLMYSKPKVSLEQIIAMRRTDGMARALGNLITLPIKMALQQGRWIAADGGDADEEVEFANLMWTLPPILGGMTTTASQTIDQMLLALFDGFATFELVSHIPERGPLKGLKTLRKMAYRDPRTVTLLQDAHGGYAGFRQQGHLANGEMRDVTLSPKKSVLFTVQGHENPLYGVSFFESAYPHYEAKLKWYYLSEMAGQFAAVPGRVGEVPSNARLEDVVAFRRALENFAFNTTMIHKIGYKVNPFSSTPGFNFLSYIEHHNLMMAKAALASFMESEQRTVLVENTTQDASADVFLVAMESIVNDFASVLTNHLMPKYIVENFKNSTNFPIFKPGPISDDARRRIASLFEKLSVSGILNTTPELVRELEKQVSRDLGLDVDYTEIEAREEEAAVQQQEQAEMLAKQAQLESIEEQRAAQDAIPDPNATSGIQPLSTRTTPETRGVEPEDANHGVSLSDTSDYDAVNQFITAANNLWRNQPLESHSVDEGLSSF